MTNVNIFFFKLVKCHGQKIKYQEKDLITRDIHVKYQSSSTHCSNVVSKVKVFKNGSNSKVEITGSKIIVPTKRGLITRNTHVKISKL